MPERLHDQIITALSRVETEIIDIKGQTRAIREHLKDLNGSVSDVVRDLAKHPYECKYGAEIQEIRRQLSTGEFHGSKDVESKLDAWNLVAERTQAGKDSANAVTARWMTAIKPLVWIIGGALIYILLTHLDELLRYYKIKP